MLQNVTEEEGLYRLGIFTLSDLPKSSNLYLFSETPDHEPSVFGATVRFVKSCVATVAMVAVIDDARDSTKGAYRGAKAWEIELGKAGIGPIIRIPLWPYPLHTLSESFAAVNFAQRGGWSDLTICAPPFHQLRCFISMVTAVNTLNPRGLRVYNLPGTPLDWREECVHSQGVLRGNRMGFLIEELRRIKKYQLEGTPVPLVSADEVLQYLEWRDSQ